MKHVTSITDLKALVVDAKNKGLKVALVPTMGNLHEGHLSLVRKAKQESDLVVVSIFVNPTQFGPKEDYNNYPRTLKEDIDLLYNYADIIFSPAVKEIYPDQNSRVFVYETKKSKILCGKFRPGHFEGVLSIVAKLFNICMPDTAYFGLKDYQQFILIRDMVRELNFNIKVVPCSIVREKEGLAMSSRNSYMSEEQKLSSLTIIKTLNTVKEKFLQGETNVFSLKAKALAVLFPQIEVQYLELVHPDTLESLSTAQKGAVLMFAGYCGKVRLIDNIIL